MNLDKWDLRKQYLAYRDGQELEIRTAKSKQIIEKLKVAECFQQSEILLIYVDCRSEVITAILIEALLEKKEKRIFCPRVSGENMDFYEITAMEQLQVGYFGIREPEQIKERLFTAELYHRKSCLTIMPGVVFDHQRGRIGYGKGFYDRFLTAYPDMPTIALAYGCQIAPEVPMGDQDRKPGMIITEEEVIYAVL